MTTQFEHNKYFTEELKEHSVVLYAITKQLDDISREVCNLQSEYVFAESLLGKISDAQVMSTTQPVLVDSWWASKRKVLLDNSSFP